MDLRSIIGRAPTPPRPAVYTVPTPLLPLQHTLVRTLLAIHAASVAHALQPPAFDPTKEPPPVPAPLPLEWLRELLALVALHPYLLVPHHMPYQMLRRLYHELVAYASGKFRALDAVLGQAETLGLKCVVVASSSKELDLVEAFVRGRQLEYARGLKQVLLTPKLPLPEVTPPMGKPKPNVDDYAYTAKPAPHPPHAFALCLLLTLHAYASSTPPRADLVVMMDGALDEASVARLGGVGIRLVPQYLVDHALAAVTGDDAVYTAIINHTQPTAPWVSPQPQPLPQWLDLLPRLGRVPAVYRGRADNAKVVAALPPATPPTGSTLGEYQHAVAAAVYRVYTEVMASTADAVAESEGLREADAVRQTAIELSVEEVASTIRRMEDAKSEAQRLAKREARTAGEAEREEERAAALATRLASLTLAHTSADLDALRAEATRLEEQVSTAAARVSTLRDTYQQTSAAAVAAAAPRSTAVAAPHPPRLKPLDLAPPVAQLERQHAFLAAFEARLATLARERTATLPTGRSGRPSRSMTPMAGPSSRLHSPA